MSRKKTITLRGNRTGTTGFAGIAAARALHPVVPARARRARPLRFERLEDRSLLAAVVVDLINTADTGRSNLDNITNQLPSTGDLVYYFPEFAGLLRLFTPSTLNVYVNGVGSITDLSVASSLNMSNPNDIEPDLFGKDPLDFLREGENLISVTAEYIDVDGSIEGGSGGAAVGGAIDEVILEGNLTLWIDTEPPTGDGHLHPDSDTGVWGASGTTADRITADPTPTFFGTAEGNSIVEVGIQELATGTRFAGSTVTDPRDGDAVQGRWQVDTNLNLANGEYYAVFSFEDTAGNSFSDPTFIDERWFLVDTQGPRVTAVEVNSPGNPYDLFAPSPADGPTPLVDSLVVNFTDPNSRTTKFLYDAVFAESATNVGHYQVVGDANGIIPIESVTFTPLNVAAGRPATGYVTINFHQPLPDDRFTLTIADSLVDHAGNALDGESNAASPGSPHIPSGDGNPGGDFVARFTVDSRPEVGVWSSGRVYLDTNGNFSFDWNNPDASNRDLWLPRAGASDQIFAGDFDGSGFDQMAAYRRTSSGIKWTLSNDQFAVQPTLTTKGPKGTPIAGDFNGNPADGDEVGVFTGKHWSIDTSNPKDFRPDKSVRSTVQGVPIVGNFDGFGGDDLGIYKPKTNKFYLSLDSQGGGITNGKITTTFRVSSGWPFNGERERPVVADMDGDGFDDIGIYRGAVSRSASAVWSFFVSGGQSLVSRIQQGAIEFMPPPFGSDIYTRFGNKTEKAIVGNFDPPVARVQANTNATSAAASAAAASLGPGAAPMENAVGLDPLTATTGQSESNDTSNVVPSSKGSTAELLAILQSLQDWINANKADPEMGPKSTSFAQSEGASLLDDAFAADLEKTINAIL